MARNMLIAAVALALWAVAPVGAHTTRSSWTAFDTEQRLTIGRFAAAHGIAYADCLGVGAGAGPVGRLTRRYRHLDCKVQDKNLKSERQLVVHVRTETTFTAEWLTTKEC